MNKKNLNCHVEPKRQLRAETSQPLHISSRDIVENAKLNHEIAEELRKYKRRHPEHCEGSSQNKKASFHWILRAKALRMTCLLGTLFLLPSLAQAEQCTPTPKCEDLGYNQSSCPDGGGVKCPWNTSLMYCCKKCAPSCEVKTCQIGDVLYSDKKCYTCPNTNTLPGIPPIGVVFSSGKAVALTDLSNKMLWSNAKSACSNYSVRDVRGWYLPTEDELLAMYSNRSSVVQGFSNAIDGKDFVSDWYWSSSIDESKTNSTGAKHYRIVNPVSGSNSIGWSDGFTFYVRPVLAF